VRVPVIRAGAVEAGVDQDGEVFEGGHGAGAGVSWRDGVGAIKEIGAVSLLRKVVSTPFTFPRQRCWIARPDPMVLQIGEGLLPVGVPVIRARAVEAGVDQDGVVVAGGHGEGILGLNGKHSWKT
jgi:hypothetical protein